MSGRYAYRAHGRGGAIESGFVLAADEAEALRALARQGKQPYALSPVSRQLKPGGLFKRSLDNAQIGEFFSDVSVLLEAGFNLDASLKACQASQNSQKASERVGKLIEHLAEGGSFADAVSNFLDPDPATKALLEAGEQSGAIGEVTGMIARNYGLRQSRRAALIDQLTYPAFLVVMMIATLVSLATFLVPALAPIFEASGKPPPFLVRGVAVLSDWVGDFGPALVATIAVAGATLLHAGIRDSAIRSMRGFVYKAPLLGSMLRQMTIARFLQNLALLIEAKLALPQALQLSVRTLSLSPIRSGLEGLGEKVASGQRLPAAMLESGQFDGKTIAAATIGDETNRIGAMLGRIAAAMDRDIERRITRLTALITPAVTIVMGATIAALAMSVMSALLGVNDLAIN